MIIPPLRPTTQILGATQKFLEAKRESRRPLALQRSRLLMMPFDSLRGRGWNAN